jgi:hypothetical protein
MLSENIAMVELVGSFKVHFNPNGMTLELKSLCLFLALSFWFDRRILVQWYSQNLGVLNVQFNQK